MKLLQIALPRSSAGTTYFLFNCWFFRLLLLVLLLNSQPQSLQAELRLPNIFGDHMVLQQDKPIRVWGWETAGKEVTATWAGQTRKATAAPDGSWSVHFAPVKATFAGRKLVVNSGAKSITISDILVGEVWLCGGQSNMEWTLRSTRDADLEISCADYPAIRFIRLPKIARQHPQADFPVESPQNPVASGSPGTEVQGRQPVPHGPLRSGLSCQQEQGSKEKEDLTRRTAL